MNSRRNLCVELILAVLVLVLHNVSCSSKSNLREERSEENVDPGEPLYLTPYLERGEVDLARNKSKVTLPGFPDIVSYAGYFDISVSRDKFHSFLWYFPAQVDSKNAPVVLSLVSPFNSSFSSVSSEPNGQFSIEKVGHLMREESWNKKQNIIYIDSTDTPSYSFLDSVDIGYYHPVHIAGELHKVVLQFFELFPWLRKNDFFVADENWISGYVTTISLQIHAYNKDATQDKKINLKGIVVGSGTMDRKSQMDFGEYLYESGLIDAIGRGRFLKEERKIVKLISTDWSNLGNSNLRKLIFEGREGVTEYTGYTGLPRNILADRAHPISNYYVHWVQKEIIRRALHVGNNKFHRRYAEKYEAAFFEDSKYEFAKLIGYYRVLYYSGNLDVLCPYPSVESIIDNLPSPSANEIKRAKRQEWMVDGELAGYIRKGGNLTQVLIRNAGRFPTVDQPKWTFQLIEAFTNGSLDTLENE